MNDKLVVAISQVVDGSMSEGVSDEQRLNHRTEFLRSLRIDSAQAILVRVTYEGDDYRRYFSVSSSLSGDGITSPSTVVADALFTGDKNIALLLPVADCIAAVLFDPVRQVIGLAHLGRHNLIQDGGKEVVDYMSRDFGTVPSDVQVWLSPAAGRQNYPLYDFENRSLHEVAVAQLKSAGIPSSNIRIDSRDTTIDAGLFSHSQFLKGEHALDGRQAVIAMMRP